MLGRLAILQFRWPHIVRLSRLAHAWHYVRGTTISALAPRWRILCALVVPFLALYGANWLVFHPHLSSLYGIPSPAEVIVVLAGSGERAPYAQSLIDRGLAPRMLFTKVFPECERMGRPLSACRTGVRNTIDEALLMRRILAQHGVERVTVVTSRVHVVRARAVFTAVFLGSGIAVTVVSPPHVDFPEETSLREVLKFLPSVGAALVGRLAPSLYEEIMEVRYGVARHLSTSLVGLFSQLRLSL